jgi:hypothetical protein
VPHDETVSDTFEAMAGLLWGDGAWELVEKRKRTKEESERLQARVGLASNVVGLASGVAATGAAGQAFKNTIRPPKAPGSNLMRYSAPGAFKRTYQAGRGVLRKYPKTVAGAALGLQVANNLGDAVANRVLARESKKKVEKSFLSQPKQPKTASGPSGQKLPNPVKQTVGQLKKIPRSKAQAAGTVATAVQPHIPPVPTLKLPKPKQPQQPQPVPVAKSEVDTLTWRGEISKRDDEKRQVFGWASVVEKNGKPIVDHQDDYIPIDVIEKAAYDYVRTSRKGGDMHRRAGDVPHHVSDMVESFLVTEEKKQAMGLPTDFPTGWWVGFQVNDEDTWQKVKSGERKEFSIHGSGQRVEKVLED